MSSNFVPQKETPHRAIICLLTEVARRVFSKTCDRLARRNKSGPTGWRKKAPGWGLALLVIALGLICLVPAFAMGEDDSFGRGEWAAVFNAETGVPSIFENVVIFDPSIDVDCLGAANYIGNFSGDEGFLIPKYLWHRVTRAESCREFLLQDWSNHLIFVSQRGDCDLGPTHDLVGRSLARIFELENDAGSIGSSGLRRIKHHSVNDSCPMWGQICPQLSARSSELPPEQTQLAESNCNKQCSHNDNGLPPLFPLVLIIIGGASFCFFYWLSGRW